SPWPWFDGSVRPAFCTSQNWPDNESEESVPATAEPKSVPARFDQMRPDSSGTGFGSSTGHQRKSVRVDRKVVGVELLGLLHHLELIHLGQRFDVGLRDDVVEVCRRRSCFYKSIINRHKLTDKVLRKS